MDEKLDTSREGRFPERDKAAIESKTPITAPAVFEVIRRGGEQELMRPATALIASALVAGLALGFSVLSKALLTAHLPQTTWAPLITSLGYTVGFLIVIMGQMQLFTENTITVVVPALEKPCKTVFLQVARLWGLVLGANLLGAFLFGVVLALTSHLEPSTWNAVLDISAHGTGRGFSETLMMGIGAGWLIAALVWIMSTTDQGHFALITVITYVISLAGFSHVIAGGVEVGALVAAGEAALGAKLLTFILPAVIGNVVGGTVIYTLLTWAQIKADRQSHPELSD